MAAIPTLAEEDARRPNRERDCLVRERTRIANRVRGALVRLGGRAFILRRGDQAENSVNQGENPGRGWRRA
jgi:transposase